MAAILLSGVIRLNAVDSQLLGWNNLGMHCMDSDYSVFSILPPYNTIETQLIVGGKLVTNGAGYSVTYEAVADPGGSLNSTSVGKGNYFDHASQLFGGTVVPETGLAGWSMPGPNNQPQAMLFETTNQPATGVRTLANWFRAEGIPITPYDDAGRKNAYPLMRLIARNQGGSVMASNDIVLPVSDEMDCRVCHASGTQAAAQPAAGWVWSRNPERDYRLNILRLHDEHQFTNQPALYQSALAARGFNAQGLYRGVVADGKPVLCASCHASEALGTGSFGSIPPLTAAVHAKHANVLDPEWHIPLDHSANRTACYRCHPGSATKCLRGAMGGAIASDGSMSMQCQSCHGNLSQVGSRQRVGWFNEPNCQSCHTGDATSNHGEIRYNSVFEANGSQRVPVNRRFATQADTPAPGLSLYRFSAGHGGLQCSACHGSTHAEFPATHRNDNLRNEKIQGHAGVTAECVTCHVSMPNNTATAVGGPHGMHPLGQGWVDFHPDAVRGGAGAKKCAVCHGADYRGSVLSRTLGPRTLKTGDDGGGATLNLFQGAMIGCYNCHNGPGSEDANSSVPPGVANASATTTSGKAVALTLPVTGLNAGARIISQPAHGSIGLNNAVATYFPDPGFVGTDTFTFAAWDGMKNSALATGTIQVAEGPYSVAAQALVPPSYPAGWAAPFTAVVASSNTTAQVSYQWDFGDGTPLQTERYAAHVYRTPGTFSWLLRVQVGQAVSTVAGDITVRDSVRLGIQPQPAGGLLFWSPSSADTVLERTDVIGSTQQWTAITNAVSSGVSGMEVRLPLERAGGYFRLRQVQ